MSRWPLHRLHALGAALGWLTWLASGSYRRLLRANADLAAVDAATRRASIAEAGRMVAELPRLWLRPRGTPLQDPVRWENADAIEQVLGRPGGLILLTPHLGSFEVAAQAYAERFGARQPITVLYRPARQQALRELEETARLRDHLGVAPATTGGVRQLVRALRNGQTVGMLPDQVPPDGQGVWAPFFGRDAYTMTLAARLARQCGSALLALWCERLPGGAGYVVRVSPLATPLAAAGAVAVLGAADPVVGDAARDVADATAINASMQALIAQAPAQYIWGYKRYKSPRRQRAAAPGDARDGR